MLQNQGGRPTVFTSMYLKTGNIGTVVKLNPITFWKVFAIHCHKFHLKPLNKRHTCTI